MDSRGRENLLVKRLSVAEFNLRRSVSERSGMGSGELFDQLGRCDPTVAMYKNGIELFLPALVLISLAILRPLVDLPDRLC